MNNFSNKEEIGVFIDALRNKIIDIVGEKVKWFSKDSIQFLSINSDNSFEVHLGTDKHGFYDLDIADVTLDELCTPIEKIRKKEKRKRDQIEQIKAVKALAEEKKAKEKRREIFLALLEEFGSDEGFPPKKETV